MAEWNPTTSYGPGANVSYLGLNYIRSTYPIAATAGTNPKEEMGTDPKGDPIRTWLLNQPTPYDVPYPYHIGYFSLKAPERSDGLYASTPPLTSYPGKLAPENPYAGPSDGQQNAYGSFGIYPEILGTSVEMDQARAAVPAGISPPTPAIPSAPVMPTEKCGVLMQNFQETLSPDPTPPDPYLNSENGWGGVGVQSYQNLVYDSVNDQWEQSFPATGRKWYVFLFFNHPLFFRRQITVTIRISTENYNSGYTIPTIPPVDVAATSESVYSSTTQVVTGTDDNYWSGLSANLADYIKPANAVFEYSLPDDETTPGPYDSVNGTNYQLVEIFVSDVQSND